MGGLDGEEGEMSDLVERLRYATRDVVTGERLESGVYGHAPVEDLEMAADRIFVLKGALGHSEREVDRLRALLETANAYGAGENAARLRAEADAERYRWLRQYIRNADETKFIFNPSAAHCDEDQFDAFIDNARAGEA
jgi:hypothetical protein